MLLPTDQPSCKFCFGKFNASISSFPPQGQSLVYSFILSPLGHYSGFLPCILAALEANLESCFEASLPLNVTS